MKRTGSILAMAILVAACSTAPASSPQVSFVPPASSPAAPSAATPSPASSATPAPAVASPAPPCPVSQSAVGYHYFGLNKEGSVFFPLGASTQVYLTISQVVLRDTAFQSLSTSADGKWSLLQGSISLTGTLDLSSDLTTFGVRGDGDIYRAWAQGIDAVACDGLNRAYPLVATLTSDNAEQNFIWLFAMPKDPASFGQFKLVVAKQAMFNLGSVSYSP